MNGLEAGSAQPSWLFDPGLVDTAPQLAIIWSRMRHDATPLPSRLGSVRRFAGGALPARLWMALQVQSGSSPHGVIYDADFVDEQGLVWLELRDIESTGSIALNRLAAHQ